MSKQVNVCIISESSLHSDPRVLRQIRIFNRRKYSIHTVGMSPSGLESQFYSIGSMPNSLLTKLYRAGLSFLHLFHFIEKLFVSANQDIISELSKTKFDLTIANDIETMMLASRIETAAIILDCHEYSPGQHVNTLKNQLLRNGITKYLTGKYINRADRCITVCKSISERYFADFGRAPEIIYNVPEYRQIEPSSVDQDRIRLVHHGAALKGRKIELMISALDFLDKRFELDLMLVPGSRDYYRELSLKVSKRDNVRLIPPVNYDNIVERINEYDIGIFYLEPNNINHAFALPNKFFEYIQARLAVAVGPSVEMSRIIKENDIGVVAQEFSVKSFAECILELTKTEIERFKRNSGLIAKKFSTDTINHKLETIIDELIPV